MLRSRIRHDVDYLFSERRKRAYRFYTLALRLVIAVGALFALFLFGMLSSAL